MVQTHAAIAAAAHGQGKVPNAYVADSNGSRQSWQLASRRVTQGPGRMRTMCERSRLRDARADYIAGRQRLLVRLELVCSGA